MGFLSDVFNDILDGGSEKFGQKIRGDNPALMELYRAIYFDFGLMAPRNIQAGSVVPVEVSTGYGGKSLYGFEIRGNIHSPLDFLSSGWGSIFHTISRDFPLAKGGVWAYDIRRLDESILIGKSTFPSDEAYKQSEESLKILRLIGRASTPPLSRVPAVELEFGRFWTEFGVPDRVSISLDSVYPFSDDHMKSVINLIFHNFNRSPDTPLSTDYSWNPLDGTIEMVMKERPKPAAAATTTPEPQTNQPEDDNFPYDFYRGLGLIDDDDLVTVPSMLGPIRTSMRNPLTKEYLLAYKPEA